MIQRNDPVADGETTDLVEIGVWAVNAILRRLWIYGLAIILALPVVYAFLKYAPKNYVTEAVVLLQPAPQPLGSTQASLGRQSAAEQIQVLQAWLTSDQILTPLLPHLVDGELSDKPEELRAVLDAIRASLVFELQGESVVRLRLSGSNAQGLGHKLEVILARLIQGLLEPDQGVLSASQLVTVHWRERFAAAQETLSQAIVAAGLEDSPHLRQHISAIIGARRLHERLIAQRRQTLVDDGLLESSTVAEVPTGADVTALDEAKASLDRARAVFKLDKEKLDRLVDAAELHDEAQRIVDALQRSRHASEQPRFFGLFARPEQLTIIGRPADPVFGKSNGFKFAAAFVLFSLLWPNLVILGLELTSRRLNMRSQFVKAAGVPVVARFG